jgi:hypothetical protein
MPDELEHDVDFSPSGVGPAKATRLQSRARGYVFLGLLVPFTALTYLAVSSDSPGDLRDRPIVLTTLATITGPFTGAIARNGQGCCFEFSASLAAFCGPVLAVGLLAQVAPLPFRRGQQAARLVLWTLCWFVWLLCGLVSFGHALS